MSRSISPAIARALSRTNSASRLRGKQAVIAVVLAQFGTLPRVLTVGRRHHQCLDHPLDVPAALAELDGQPVEQFEMRGPLALRADVVEHAADPGAEELLPQAI